MLKTDRLYIATLLQAAGDGTNTANQCIHWPVSSIKGLQFVKKSFFFLSQSHNRLM